MKLTLEEVKILRRALYIVEETAARDGQLVRQQMYDKLSRKLRNEQQNLTCGVCTKRQVLSGQKVCAPCKAKA